MGKFVIDSSITFVARVLQIVLGLGASIVIARILGPQGQGTYFLAILLPSLLVTFGGFGIWWLIDLILIATKYPFKGIEWIE